MMTPHKQDSTSLKKRKYTCRKALDFGSTTTIKDVVPFNLNIRKDHMEEEEEENVEMEEQHNTKRKGAYISIDPTPHLDDDLPYNFRSRSTPNHNKPDIYQTPTITHKKVLSHENEPTDFRPNVMSDYFLEKDDSPILKEKKLSCKSILDSEWSHVEEKPIIAYTKDGFPLDFNFTKDNQKEGLKCNAKEEKEVKDWLKKEQLEFERRASYFIKQTRVVQGERPYMGWKGSVVNSVVGAFLTQNTSDKSSSSIYTSLSSNYPIKNSMKDPDNNNRTEHDLDWNEVRLANVKDISDILQGRGQHKRLAERIQAFLNSIYDENSGSFDMEWLRTDEPEIAKLVFIGIHGLGVKCMECLRLLTLRQKAFPVDTHVSRIVVRLGWVPIKELPDGLLFHELKLYPMIPAVHEYLKHRISNLDADSLYELHYQMITFGKVFCTKISPNCNACPLKEDCKHYKHQMEDIEDLCKVRPATKAKSAKKPDRELRTIHQVYELPDNHTLLQQLDKRDLDDKHPYLLLVWRPPPPAGKTGNPHLQTSSDTEQEELHATILVPCRTATRGSFPLDGTYFQPNEVFAVDGISKNPLVVRRNSFADLQPAKKRLVCGTTISKIFEDLSAERIKEFFLEAYLCIHGFNIKTRVLIPLPGHLHPTLSQTPKKGSKATRKKN